MNAIIETTRVDNGVNVEALLGARETLTNMPEAAHFNWRATCEWVKGTHARSTIKRFFGLGEEQMHNQSHMVETDHPVLFASEDHGATPVEIVLAGLAGCLTAGIAAVAQHRNIQIHKVTATLEAGMGLPFMRRRKSSFIHGAEDDARDLAEHLAHHLDRQASIGQVRRAG